MTGPVGSRLFDLNRDLAQLNAQIDAIGGVSLIVIDPITAYLGKKDANKMGDVRAILAQLAQFAEATCTCVLAINHFNKDAGKKAAYRMSGSLGFSAAARSVSTLAMMLRRSGMERANRSSLVTTSTSPSRM